MRGKSTEKERNRDFRILIPEYDDNQIIEILKKRNHYQQEAYELALNEAIKRGIIHTEQDLLGEDFRVKPMIYSFFPSMDRAHQMDKTRKSISRALIITGIFPVIWGFIRMKEELKLEGSVLILMGILWIFLSVRVFQEIKKNLIYSLLAILALSALYITKIFTGLKEIIFMDIFIVAIFYVLIIYGLLYLLRLKK